MDALIDDLDAVEGDDINMLGDVEDELEVDDDDTGLATAIKIPNNREDPSVRKFVQAHFTNKQEQETIRKRRAEIVGQRVTVCQILRTWMEENNLTCIPVRAGNESFYLRRQTLHSRKQLGADVYGAAMRMLDEEALCSAADKLIATRATLYKKELAKYERSIKSKGKKTGAKKTSTTTVADAPDGPQQSFPAVALQKPDEPVEPFVSEVLAEAFVTLVSEAAKIPRSVVLLSEEKERTPKDQISGRQDTKSTAKGAKASKKAESSGARRPKKWVPLPGSVDTTAVNDASGPQSANVEKGVGVDTAVGDSIDDEDEPESEDEELYKVPSEVQKNIDLLHQCDLGLAICRSTSATVNQKLQEELADVQGLELPTSPNGGDLGEENVHENMEDIHNPPTSTKEKNVVTMVESFVHRVAPERLSAAINLNIDGKEEAYCIRIKQYRRQKSLPVKEFPTLVASSLEMIKDGNLTALSKTQGLVTSISANTTQLLSQRFTPSVAISVLSDHNLLNAFGGIVTERTYDIRADTANAKVETKVTLDKKVVRKPKKRGIDEITPTIANNHQHVETSPIILEDAMDVDEPDVAASNIASEITTPAETTVASQENVSEDQGVGVPASEADETQPPRQKRRRRK